MQTKLKRLALVGVIALFANLAYGIGWFRCVTVPDWACTLSVAPDGTSATCSERRFTGCRTCDPALWSCTPAVGTCTWVQFTGVGVLNANGGWSCSCTTRGAAGTGTTGC